MNREDIISMAIEAELIYNEEGWCGWVEDTDLRPFIERFAALVAAAEAKRADALAATIAALRDIVTNDAESKADFIARVRNVLGSCPDQRVLHAVEAEREACAKICDERERPNLYGVRECAAAIREALAEQPAQQGITLDGMTANEFALAELYAFQEATGCDTADQLKAQQREPVAWKLMPRKATDEMLKAMDECSTEGYDERLYAGHASSVYMAAVDAAPTPPAQRKPLTDEPNEKLLSAAGTALEVLEKHRQMKGEYPVGMLGVRAAEEIKAAIEAAHGIKGGA